jgi:hypothetical protein
VLAADVAADWVAAADALVGTERDQRVEDRAAGLVRGVDLAARRRQLARDLVLDLQPGQRQQLAIDDLDLQLDRLAELGRPPAEAPPVLQPGQAIALVELRESGREQQRQRQEKQRRLPSQQAEGQEEDQEGQRRRAERGCLLARRDVVKVLRDKPNRETQARRVSRQRPIQGPELAPQLLSEEDISRIVGGLPPEAEGNSDHARTGLQWMQLERKSFNVGPRFGQIVGKEAARDNQASEGVGNFKWQQGRRVQLLARV